jgi:hypothetical protein
MEKGMKISDEQLQALLKAAAEEVAVPDGFSDRVLSVLRKEPASAPSGLLREGFVWNWALLWKALAPVAAVAMVVVALKLPWLGTKAAPGADTTLVCKRVVCPSAGDPACISFVLKDPGPVKVEVFTSTGATVVALHQDHVAAGAHQLYWDGHDANEKIAKGNKFMVVITAAGRTEKQEILKDPDC